MKKKSIIQFLPYFPPHKGGLESHAKQWGNWWVKKGYGNVYNVITDIGQDYEFIFYLNSLENGPHLTSLENGPHLNSLENSPHLTSLENGPHLNSVENSPHLNSLENSPHLTSLENGPHLTSVENSPHLTSPKGRGIEQVMFNGDKIGYIMNGVEILVVPSIEIVPNFPIYKIWSKEYRLIVKYLKSKILAQDFENTSTQPSILEKTEQEAFVVVSRTRFFVTSFVGGIFARKNNIKWIHIEHGSGYVTLNSKFKNIVAKMYDRLIGKWIFKKADKLVGVSNACKNFIQDEFVDRHVDVIYRGLDFDDIKNDKSLKEKFPEKIIVGFVGRLYKWKNIETLIKVYYELDDEIKNKIQIVIAGEGEDFDRLNKIDFDNKIYFTGGVSFEKALEVQKQFDIHFHTSSQGGGLATTLLQAMHLGCLIVSTPYEGAKEVIVDGKNGILLMDDSFEEIKKGLEKGIEMINKKEEFALVNRSIIDEGFTWHKNIEKYYKLFNDEK